MATGSLYGSTSESTGLYGIGAASGGTYFEWFIFQDSATAPATPTGGSWSFTTNTGTAPTGWVASPPASPVNQVWVSLAIVDSRSTSSLTWTTPGLMSNFGNSVANYLTFVATSAPAYSAGRLWYDTNQKSFAYYNDVTNNVVHIGQETQLKVYNNTGSTITRGTPVYISSTSSGFNYPLVALAKADNQVTGSAIGLANQDIPTATAGYVTTAGLITGNTGSFAVGDTLYVSPYSAGQLMNTVPPTGYAVKIGIVAYSNTPNGTIYVSQTNAYVNAAQIVGAVAIANGGTGATTASTARTALGLGTIATQDANNVAITGGSIALTTALPITSGGTGAITAAAARTSLSAVGLTDTQTLTNKTISGSSNTLTNIGNSSLSNNSVTVNGSAIALGSSATITAATANNLVFGSQLSANASFNGSQQVNVNLLAVSTAGTYGTSNVVPVFTLNAYGQITNVSPQTITVDTSDISGTIGIAQGGTGASNVINARVNLLPSYTGNAGKLLALNAGATDLEWRAVSGVGTVTSVDVSGGTTGLTTYGGPITAAGTVTLAGTLNLTNGGTGATTAASARTNLGATTVGSNMFMLANPSAITFPRLNADNTVSALDAATFRTAIGAGTSSTTGTVTSVAASVPAFLSISGSPITASGTLAISLSGTALPTANGGTGLTSFTSGGVVYASSTSALATGSALTFDGTLLTNSGTSTGATLELLRLSNNGGGANAASQLSFYAASTNYAQIVGGYGSSSPALTYNVASGGYQAWQIAASEQMRLTSTGLGIGTSSPAYKLDVLNTNAINGGAIGARLTTGSGTFAVTGANPRGTGLIVNGNVGSNVTIPIGGNYDTFGIISAAQTGTGAYPTTAIYGYSNSGTGNGYGLRTDVVSTGTVNYGLYIGSITGATTNYGIYVNDTSAINYIGGNLGLGVTPSAWGSGLKAFEASTASFMGDGSGIYLSSNWYYNAGNKYIGTGNATSYQQFTGQHIWYTAPSGTAGNAITFTQAMTLDASGSLLVGTTTTVGARMSLQATAASGTSLWSINDATLNYSQFYFGGSATGGYQFIRSDGRSTGWLAFGTVDTERARIDSSGNLLVGTTSVNGVGWTLNPNGSGQIRSSGTGAQDKIQFANSNGVVGAITTTGSVTAYNVSSDYRLKNITGPIATSGAYIDSLNPVEGTWKADGSTFVGLIAHEAQEASRTTVATGVKDGDQMQGMDYSSAEIIANLIAEVQSLRKRLADAGI